MTQEALTLVPQRTRAAFAALAAAITLTVLGCLLHIASVQARNVQVVQAIEIPLQTVVVIGKRV